MKLVWHIAKKDLRRMALPAALWVAFVVGATIWFRTASPGEGMAGAEAMVGWLPMMQIWVQLFTVAQFLIGYVFTGALLLEDPLIGAEAFWLTRPMANARLLLAKLLAVALLFVVAPVAGLALMRLGCGFSLREVWGATSVVGLRLVMVSASGVMVASLSRSLVQFLFGSVVMAVVALFAMGRVLILWPSMFNFEPRYFTELVASRILVRNLAFACGCGLVVAWQFLTRKRIGGWMIVAAVIVACLSIRVTWPWNTWAAWHGPATATAVPPDSRVSIVTKRVSLNRYPERFSERSLQMNAALAVTPGRAADGTWYAPAGGRISVTWENSTPRYGITLAGASGSWADGCALAYLQERFEPTLTWRLFGMTNSSAQLPSGEARISGTCEIWSAKARIMGELRMVTGGELAERGSVSRVIAVESSIGWEKMLAIEEHRPDVRQEAEVFALFNRQTKDALIVTHNDLGFAEMNGEAIVLRRLFVPEVHAGEEWRRDAVLVKVRLEPVGRFTVPFEARAKVKVIEEER